MCWRQLVWGLLAGLAACQSDYDRVRHLMAGGQVEWTTPADTLALEWIDSLPWVRAQVDGRPTRLLVDTGLPTLLLPELLPQARPSAHALRRDDSTVLSQHFGPAPAITLGRTRFVGAGAGVPGAPTVAYLRAREASGVLGASLMQHAVWHFDFAANRLVLARQMPAGPWPPPLPFIRDEWRAPKLKAQWPRFPRMAQLRLSTGYAGGVKLDRSYLRDAPFVLDPPTGSPCRPGPDDAAGLALTSPPAPARSCLGTSTFQIAGHWWAGVPASIRPDGRGHLGLAALRPYHLLIDWPARRVYLGLPTTLPKSQKIAK
jgi:hypothetical protein